MPLLSSGIVLFVFLRFMLVSLFTSHSRYPHATWFIVFTFMVIPTIIAIRRYIDLIRFHTVSTRFSLPENIDLLQQFLKEQQLITFRYPQAPGVFQIISKNISALYEEREVLIFIADDKRILINSHFTSSRKKFRFLSAPTHHQQMITLLKNWLNTRKSTATNISVPTF